MNLSKLVSLSTAVAFSAAMTLQVALLTTPAMADNNAATVNKDLSCGGFVPGSIPTVSLFTTEGHSVVTSSGNTSLTCHFDIPAGQEPSKATHAEGFLCGTFLGVTTDSRMVATPGGTATLTCVIHAN